MTEQTVGWALHALEPDEELAAIEHLGSCPECRGTASQVAELTTGLAGAVEQVDPPPGLRASIVDEAARTPQEPSRTARAEPARVEPAQAEPDATSELGPAAGPRHRAQRSGVAGPGDGRAPGRRSRLGSRGRILVAALAAVGVLVGGGALVSYAQQMRSERDQSMAQAHDIFDAVARFDRPGARHAFLAPPTPNAQPVAAVMVDGPERMVISMGLHPNSIDDQTYVLWGIDGHGAPRAVGTFDVRPAPGSPISVGSAPGGSFARYAISLERGREAPAAPSTVVATGQVET